VLRVRLLLVAVPVAVLAIAAVVLAGAAGGTVSSGPAPTPFGARGSFDASGNPEPTVNSYPDGAASAIHWSLCAPPNTGACDPISSTDGIAHPGPQPAGTVFKLTATYRGQTYLSSETWRGVVHAVTRPVLHGRARFGATVAGSAANWTGGWGTENDQLGLEACRTTRATGCVMLSGEELQCRRGGACGSLGGVLGPLKRPNRARVGNWYTGWYLFALDARLANTASGLLGYASPAAIPPWPTNATVRRSQPYGPVTGPPAPQVRFVPHAPVDGNHVSVATVRCAVSCHAWITVNLTRKHLSSSDRRVAWSANKLINGSVMIGVWGSIPPGRVAVTINVGDGPYLHGHSLLR
jgi:hypothetical protein